MKDRKTLCALWMLRRATLVATCIATGTAMLRPLRSTNHAITTEAQGVPPLYSAWSHRTRATRGGPATNIVRGVEGLVSLRVELAR